MKKFGEGLRESVREGGGHDGTVVVVVRLGKPPAELLASEPGRDREHPDVVPDQVIKPRHLNLGVLISLKRCYYLVSRQLVTTNVMVSTTRMIRT